MIWYEIKNIKGVHTIFKNVEIGKGIGCRKVFSGLKYECEKYIETKGIKLGKANARTINSERIV